MPSRMAPARRRCGARRAGRVPGGRHVICALHRTAEVGIGEGLARHGRAARNRLPDRSPRRVPVCAHSCRHLSGRLVGQHCMRRMLRDDDGELLQRPLLGLQQAAHDLVALLRTRRQAGHLRAQALLRSGDLLGRPANGGPRLRRRRIDMTCEGREQPGNMLADRQKARAHVDDRALQLVVRRRGAPATHRSLPQPRVMPDRAASRIRRPIAAVLQR